MKKIFCLIFVVVSFVNVSKSQEFAHDIGASVYILVQGDALIAMPGIIYSPRLNLVEIGRDNYLSLGSHLGFMLQFDNVTGGYFGFDLPLVAEINMGYGASPDARRGVSFGGYAGAGLGYSYMYLADWFDSNSFSTVGVVFTLGSRFEYKQKPVRLGSSLLVGFTENTPIVIGLNACYSLGGRY